MELQTGAGSLRRDGGVTSRVTRRGKAPLCAAGLILCFQVLSIQAISFQFTKEPKSQDALHGRSAMLRCEVSDPANITYIWYKDDSRLKNTERRFQEGSNLKFISVDRQLDAGNFSCRASNSATGELLLSTTASFNIKWLESGGVTLKEPVSDGEIESSTTVTLRCHIDGHPRPTCQWFKDGVKLTESSHQINNKERTLTIQSASLDDSGLYYCCANNAAGHVCSNHNFTLTIIEKLKFTPTPQPSQCLELDKEITIQCSAKGREVPTIRWTKADGGELPPHLDQRNGQLRFAKVTRSDAGNYTCIASNSLQGEIRALVTLTVAVYVRFKVEPENTTVYQGHTAVLHCQASGDPEPHIHWMVKDKPLDITKNGRIQKMPDGSLLIREVTTEDTGRYTCVAGNSCSIEDRVAQLYVVAAPVWVSKPQDSSLEEGKPGYLHCYAQANPEPEVTWFRSSLIIAPEDTRFKLFPNGTLRINNVEVYDAHMYGCTTTNLAGSLSGLAKVTVLEKLKFTPTPQPSQCLELDKEITIQCSAKGREVPTIRWTKADGGELPLHLDQRNGQLRFAKVNRSDAGNYTCIASNSLQGEIRAMVTLTVAESRRR